MAILLHFALFTYFGVTLALVLHHIFTVGDASNFTETVQTVLLLAVTPLAVLVYAGWTYTYRTTPVPFTPWRVGMVAKATLSLILVALIVELLLRNTTGLLVLGRRPLLSRIDALTSLLVPATFAFPLLVLALYIGAQQFFVHSEPRRTNND